MTNIPAGKVISVFMTSVTTPALQTANLSAGTSSRLGRRLFLVLGAVALVYALVAGFRTVSDPDLGWQLASGRWIAQHHHVFSTDVFSFTANGQPWVYPAGSELLLYGVYLLGGYTLLSWFGAAACVATVALLLRRGSAFAAAVAVLAIPLIADRTTPRAEMFTVILFAAFLSLLWQHYETGRASLWLLPLLMIGWVNLHLGFLAGLMLLAGFVGLECLRLLSSDTRSDAVRRIRHIAPALAATAIATLVNPWGWGIYGAIARQNRAMAQHSHLIDEWAKGHWNWSGAIPSFSRAPLPHTLTMLMLVVLLAAVIALWQWRLGAAVLLLGAMYESTVHIRMEALTACVVVVVAGAILSESVSRASLRIPAPRLRTIAAIAAAALIAALAVWRSEEFASDRAYLASNSLFGFGAGLGWWLPQGAADFMNREDLPANVFNSYDEGGFLVWKTGLKYRDYIDGRALPFGPEALPREERLLGISLDSQEWQQEADRYNLNTVVLPLEGHEIAFEQLPDLCYGKNWQPVYLDELAIVLVRRKPENENLINRLQINCANVPLPGAPLDHNARSFRRWVNTAHVLYVLRRYSEALDAADNAARIFPDNIDLRRVRGAILYASSRRAEAEQEWLAALALSPDPAVWFQLGEMYEQQQRTADALHAWQRTVQLTLGDGASASPLVRTLRPRALLKLARIYVISGQPRPALQALDEAMRSAPPAMLEATSGRSFKFDVAQGRAAAWRALGDLQQATSFEEEAAQLDPEAADAWSHLAKLYARQGRVEDQHRAEARAAALSTQ